MDVTMEKDGLWVQWVGPLEPAVSIELISYILNYTSKDLPVFD